MSCLLSALDRNVCIIKVMDTACDTNEFLISFKGRVSHYLPRIGQTVTNIKGNVVHSAHFGITANQCYFETDLDALFTFWTCCMWSLSNCKHCSKLNKVAKHKLVDSNLLAPSLKLETWIKKSKYTVYDWYVKHTCRQCSETHLLWIVGTVSIFLHYIRTAQLN